MKDFTESWEIEDLHAMALTSKASSIYLIYQDGYCDTMGPDYNHL